MLAFIQYPSINPIIVQFGPYDLWGHSIGPLAARWYGMAYLAGFALAYLTLGRMIVKGWLKITKDDLADLITWLVLGVLVGGRMGWWIFYHRPPAANVEPEPWYEPIAMWHGGMSFHGGLAGVTLAAFIWCRLHKVRMLHVGDCLALVTPIGLCFGRIANFINAELRGRPTRVPWGVIFPGETFPRHPSQLYEAFLEGLVLMGILWLAALKFRPREGRLTALFLIAYGLLRFGVEFTREPDVQLGYIAFGWLTMGQLLSLAIALIGVLLWFSRTDAEPGLVPVEGIR